MTAQELLSDVRLRLADSEVVGFSDQELLAWLNESINTLCLTLVGAKDSQMVKTLSVTPGTTVVPSDFYRFVGEAGLNIDGGTFKANDGSTTVRQVRYFATKPRLVAMSDAIPFGDWSTAQLVNATAAVAMQKWGLSNQGETEQAIRTGQAIAATKFSGRGAPGGQGQ